MIAINAYTLPTEQMIGGETKTLKFVGTYDPTSNAARIVLLNYVCRNETPVLSKDMTVGTGDISVSFQENDTLNLNGKFIYQVTVSSSSGAIDVQQGVLYIHRNVSNGTPAPQGTDIYHLSYVTAHGQAPADKDVFVWSGDSYTLTAADLPVLTAEGYRFDGWSKSVGATISADTTLTASWTEIVYSTITLTYTSAHGVTPSDQTRSFQQGESYTLTATDLPTLSESGYVFGGWNKNVGDQVTSDTTLVASWSAAEGAVVYYGTGTPVNRNDMPSFSGLTQGFYVTGEEVTFTTTTGSGQYSYFAFPASLGTAGFKYMFPNEGAWLAGGYTLLGTTTYEDVSYTVYRTTNANLGQMTTSVTIT